MADRGSPSPYALGLLLLGFTTIYSAQGAIVGVAVPVIVRDLHIGYTLMGVFLGVWMLVSALSASAFGRVFSRVPLWRMRVLLVVNTSLASIASGLAPNSLLFNLARVWFSVLAPFTWPVAARHVSISLEYRQRGIASAIYNLGSMVGLALSYAVFVVLGEGWRPSMIALGAAGLVYLALLEAYLSRAGLARASEDVSASAPRGVTGGRLSLGALRYVMPFLFAGHFTAVFAWAFMVNWLSTYITQQLGFSYGLTAAFMMAITAVSSVWELSNGRYIDRVGGVRPKLMTFYVGFGGSAALMALAAIMSSRPSLAFALVLASVLFWRSATPSLWPLLNDVAPLALLPYVTSLYVSAVYYSNIAQSLAGGFVIGLTGSATYLALLTAAVLAFSPVSFTLAVVMRKRHADPTATTEDCSFRRRAT